MSVTRATLARRPWCLGPAAGLKPIKQSAPKISYGNPPDNKDSYSPEGV